MPPVIDEKEIDSLPITMDPEVLELHSGVSGNASAGGCATGAILKQVRTNSSRRFLPSPGNRTFRFRGFPGLRYNVWLSSKKILFNERTARLLKRLLSGLEISAVEKVGWTGVTNGALLRQAEDQFDAFITTEKNLRYQQNLTGKQAAIVDLPTNQVSAVALLASAVQEVWGRINPGIVEILLP